MATTPAQDLVVVPPGTRPSSSSAKRCYLVFAVAGEGSLLTKWEPGSDAAPENAVAVFETTQDVPAFKLKEPARELIRGFRAGGKSAFCSGFCQFVALARKCDAGVELLTPSVQVFVRAPNAELRKVQHGSLTHVGDATAVVCVGEHSDTFRAGTSFTIEQMTRMAAGENGAGLSLA